MASTLGVLVPPSLVLILLSDAMLSAHTIAVTATGRNDRVINTQDIFHAALLPGGIFLALCLALSWIAGRSARAIAGARAADAQAQALLAVVALALLILLLGGVTSGYFYAVEAAAMGAFALLVTGLGSGRLHLDALNKVLARRHRADRRAVHAAARRHHLHHGAAAARHRRPGRPHRRRRSPAATSPRSRSCSR